MYTSFRASPWARGGGRGPAAGFLNSCLFLSNYSFNNLLLILCYFIYFVYFFLAVLPQAPDLEEALLEPRREAPAAILYQLYHCNIVNIIYIYIYIVNVYIYISICVYIYIYIYTYCNIIIIQSNIV